MEPREHWRTLCTDIVGLEFDDPLASAPGGFECFYALLRDALREGGPPPVDPRDAQTTLRVSEAAQQSSIARTVVTL